MNAGSPLSVKNLSVSYRSRGIFGKKEGSPALHDISFDIAPGEIFGLIGESGCGKTTFAKTAAGLIPYEGSILSGGKEIRMLTAPQRSRLVQLVFQNPDSALDPSMTVSRLLDEPLAVRRCGNRSERRIKCSLMLETVGLDPALGDRRIGELSGGQRQRVAIGCALLADPELVICDEILASLDASVQAQILNLLAALNRDSQISFLFISHDLQTVCCFCDRVAVMERGRIVETGSGEDIFYRPQHPYTQRLRNAVIEI